jgi:hypothetical protein
MLELGNKDCKQVNIYADEVQNRKDPNTGDLWHYICLIIEDIDCPLLPEITKLRYCNNFDSASPFYAKNDVPVHWVNISSADQKNILNRWFSYICNPDQKTWRYGKEFELKPSVDTFRFYIRGINSTKLNDSEFDSRDDFCSKYNRFFRGAALFALKSYFPKTEINIKNIFHEEGPQQNNVYFPWHVLYKISQDPLITTEVGEVKFLPKNHQKDEKSNIIQLCDSILGASVNILHGVDNSNRAKSKEDLIELFFPLFERLIRKPHNKNSSYKYFGRMAIDFFPRKKTDLGDIERYENLFYKDRPLQYELNKVSQRRLFS